MKRADVINHFGSQAAAARALGLTRAAINNWGEIIPRGSAYAVQAITGGALLVDPAVYPPKRFGPRKPRKSSPRRRLTA